jgi:hypothetical protein
MKMTLRMIVQSSVSLLVSSVFAAALLAGPGPQYWIRPTVASAPKAAAAPKAGVAPKAEVPVVAKCDGCKTTPLWVVSDRGPAGKGVPGTRVVGSQHSCTRCVGINATEHGKVKSVMTPSAACGPLLCCK